MTYRAVNKVCSESGTATELSVGGQDTGVNNVDSASRAGGGVVDVGGGVLVAVRNTAKSPCGASLGSEGRGVNLLVLLNVGNLLVLVESQYLNEDSLHLGMQRSHRE